MPRLVPDRAPDPREPSDAVLLGAVCDGDETAFDTLMRRKSQQLFGLAYRMIGDREEARDIVQLTFLKVWEKRATYNPRWSPNTWLYRIATNLSIDYLRSRRSRQQQSEPFRMHLFRLVEGRRQKELTGLKQQEVTRILHELADDLSEKQRLAFLLREVEDLPSREVAEILQCRTSTVRNHLFTARRRLREELRRRYPEYAAKATGETA